MGKNLRQQRRGKGSPRFRSPSHRFIGDISYLRSSAEGKGEVVDIKHDPIRTAPVAIVQTSDDKMLIIATEGMHVGQQIDMNKGEVNSGNILTLEHIPEGTEICNIELNPGDGGRLCRAAGSSCVVVSHDKAKTTVRLPSRKFKVLNSMCRATVGKAAGAGRIEKPFTTAGNKYYAMRARNRYWPKTKGVAKNPVDHPFGGSAKPGKHKTVARDAPPGKKVGSLAARRMGRKK